MSEDQRPERLLKLGEVCHKTSLGSTFIYQQIKKERFPKSIKLAEKCVRWRESEIDAWILQRQAESVASAGGQ